MQNSRLHRFSQEDQLSFARLSGDYNPMHVNPVAARKYIFGSSVVHGMHLVFCALEYWMEKNPWNVVIRELKAEFLKPALPEKSVNFIFTSGHCGSTRLEVYSKELLLAEIQVTLEENQSIAKGSKDVLLINDFPPEEKPIVVDTEQIPSCSGNLDMFLPLNYLATLFPHLSKHLLCSQIAGLLAASRLVGMKCPGFNSVFSGFEFVYSEEKINHMAYHVRKYDKRFGLCNFEILSPGFEGKIVAFLRPEPPLQPGFSAIKEFVRNNEFSGQTALIIGGSRGLGEVTAKLLAAGGARVVLTYKNSQKEAELIKNDIIQNSGNAEISFFDIFNPENTMEHLFGNSSAINLYYFATPSIFVGVSANNFSSEKFTEFISYYVTGLNNTFQSLKILRINKLFYPSTISITERSPGMKEYIIAKVAGEYLLSFIEQQNFKTYSPRLPRMVTDQTVSLFPVENQNPVTVLLNELRIFRDLHTERQ